MPKYRSAICGHAHVPSAQTTGRDEPTVNGQVTPC